MSEKHQECSECGKPLAHRVHSPTYGTHAYREPGASPQATRHVIDHTTCINVEDEIEYMKWIDKRNAAQPVAGTTPTLNELLESARKHVMTNEEKEAQRQSWVRGEMALSEIERGMTSPFPPMSEGTTPQVKRLVAELKAARTAWHEDFGVPVSEKYANFLGAIGKLTDYVEARAVAPVETANFVQLLPGGMCFAHGRYEGYQCPQWPKCITDPQKQEYLAQAQTLNATTFGDAGEG